MQGNSHNHNCIAHIKQLYNIALIRGNKLILYITLCHDKYLSLSSKNHLGDTNININESYKFSEHSVSFQKEKVEETKIAKTKSCMVVFT